MIPIDVFYMMNKFPSAKETKVINLLLFVFIAKIFVYKHCFCYLNVESVN